MKTEITSISSFLDILKARIQRNKRFEFFFRGHDDSEYDLIPSIYRSDGFIRNEDKFFKEAILRSSSDFDQDRTSIEKLVRMQHYGIPTRLLDITSNALVALFFASYSKPKADGEVVIFRIPKRDIKFHDSDTVTVLANIAKRPVEEVPSNIMHPNSNNNLNETVFGTKLLHEIREDKPHFMPLIVESDLHRVLAVKAKLTNSRIIKQSGAFLLFGIGRDKTKPARIPDGWSSRGASDRLIVTSNSKGDIVDELEMLGISEATLFPELENQSQYLKKLFK